ncbi:MAG: methyltransferase domain-containing protein [Alphaproteobacteria bacterium]|nr:methyltransferase domain-containing protein [Alphaproteobacteria bacterium]MBV9151322.1 methyltransferase domain-containing protein [Alphaproteobacteria bacterium]
MQFDPETVRAFEHAGWQQSAAAYDATFAHATMPFVEALLDTGGVTVGTALLDLCCGTGVVTGAATARGARAIGYDFSPAILNEARQRHPQLRFDEGDAEELPYADRSFDAVVSNFGVHHVPRPEKALAEAFRVLRPRGRVAATTWAEPAQNIAWRLLFDAIRKHGDANAAKTPSSGGNLGTIEATSRLLRQAGFTDVRAEPVHREWRVREPREIIASLARGTVRTAALIAAQPAAAVPAIEAAVARAAAEYRRGDGYAVPIVAILASGTRA